MPKLTDSLPEYRRKTVRDVVYAVVTLDGKDHYIGTFGSDESKKEDQRLTGEWQANGRRLPMKSGYQITVAELIATYWQFAKSYYVKKGKPTDEQAGIKVALRHVRQLYGNTLAKDFGPLALESVRNQMIDIGNCRNYVNNNVGRVSECFDGQYPSNLSRSTLSICMLHLLYGGIAINRADFYLVVHRGIRLQTRSKQSFASVDQLEQVEPS